MLSRADRLCTIVLTTSLDDTERRGERCQAIGLCQARNGLAQRGVRWRSGLPHRGLLPDHAGALGVAAVDSLGSAHGLMVLLRS